MVSRRAVVAAAAVALAGCSGGDPNATNESDPRTDDASGQPDQPADDAPTTTDAPPATDASSADAASTTDPSPTVEWDEVAEFRKWLTDYSPLPGSNSRFDYQRGYADSYVAGGRVAFLELSPDDVSGHLTQSGTVVHLGSFDGEAMIGKIEASDEHERTGEYEGYATASATDANTELAVGDDAVLAGADVTEWIDARRGNRPRLEDVDPEFTRLFRRLPDRGIVAGQYGSPAGGEIDIDAISLWGTSMPSLDDGTSTWVYVFEEETDVTDDVLAELRRGLEPLTEELTGSAVDGRFATITGVLALPE